MVTPLSPVTHRSVVDETEEITTTMFVKEMTTTRISVTTHDSSEEESCNKASDSGDEMDGASITGGVTSLERWRTLVANNEHTIIPQHYHKSNAINDNMETAKATTTTTAATRTSGKKSVVVNTKEIIRSNVFCGIEISSSRQTMTSTDSLTYASSCEENSRSQDLVVLLDKSSQSWMSALHNKQQQQQHRMSIVVATPSILDQDDDSAGGSSSDEDDGNSDAGDSNSNIRGPMRAPVSISAEASLYQEAPASTKATRGNRFFCNPCRCGTTNEAEEEEAILHGVVQANNCNSSIQKSCSSTVESSSPSIYESDSNAEAKIIMPHSTTASSSDNDGDSGNDNDTQQNPQSPAAPRNYCFSVCQRGGLEDNGDLLIKDDSRSKESAIEESNSYTAEQKTTTIVLTAKPSYMEEESKLMIPSIGLMSTSTQDSSAEKRKDLPAAEIIMVDFGETPVTNHTSCIAKKDNSFSTESVPSSAEPVTNVVIRNINSTNNEGGDPAQIVDDIVAVSTGIPFVGTNNEEEARGNILFQAVGGCMGTHDVMTIPMAESDIYSCREHLDSEYDDIGEEGGHDDEVDLISSASCSSSSSSDASSDVTGPLPMISNYCANNEAIPIDVLLGGEDARVVVADSDGFMSPLNFEEGTTTYSIDNDTMVLPSHLHFCNAVADGILVYDNSMESADRYEDFTDSFERHIADEFVKTFTGFDNLSSDDVSCCSSNDEDNDDGFKSCAAAGIFKIAPSGDSDNFADDEKEEEGSGVCDQAKQEKTPEHDGADAVQSESQSFHLAMSHPSKVSQSLSACHPMQQSQELSAAVATSTGEFGSFPIVHQAEVDHPVNDRTPDPKVGLPEVRSSHTDLWSHASLSAERKDVASEYLHGLARNKFATQRANESVEISIVDHSKESAQASAYQSSSPNEAEGLKLTQSQYPITEIALPAQPSDSLEIVEPAEVPTDMSQSQLEQPLPSIDIRSENQLCPAQPPPEAETKAHPPVSSGSSKFVPSGPSGDCATTNSSKSPKCPTAKMRLRQLEPMADIIVIGGSQEQIWPQDEAEAALAQTGLDLDTPQHSNRTSVLHQHRDPSGLHQHSEVSESSPQSPSTFVSFFRKLSCIDESENDRGSANVTSTSTHDVNEPTSSNNTEPNSSSNSNELPKAVLNDFKEERDEATVCFALLCGCYVEPDEPLQITQNELDQSQLEESVVDSVDLPDLVDSEDTAENTSDGSPGKPIQLGSTSSNNVLKDDKDYQSIASSNKMKNHRGHNRSSSEVSASVGQVLQSIFSEPNREGRAQEDENITIPSTSTSSKRSNGSQEEVTSNADQVLIALFEYSSEEEEEIETSDSEGVLIGDKIMIVSTAKAKPTTRTTENVSNSVEKVLHDLFEAPTSDESVALSEGSEDEFLNEITNNFFDLFNVSTSTTMIEDEESTELDDSGTTQVPQNDLSKSMTELREADDCSDRDDATLNYIDFGNYGVNKISSDITAIHYDETQSPNSLAAEEGDEDSNNDFPVDDPGFFFGDDNNVVGASPRKSCTMIVPFSQASLVLAGAPMWPLYPALKQLIGHERCLIFLNIGAIKLQASQPISSMRDLPPVVKGLLSSYATSMALLAHHQQGVNFESNDLNQIVPYTHTGSARHPETTVRTSHMAIVSVEESNIFIETCGPSRSPRALTVDTPTPSSVNSVNPEWSFLDLEKSIDESLDIFMNDLLSPVGDASNDLNSVSEVTALQELLSSEYCDEIVDSINKQKDIEETLQLHLDPSTSSLDYGCSSNSSLGSSIINLKAAALLSDGGESEIPNDFSLDEHPESPKPENRNFLGGMTLGIAGFLGEEDISSKLDDPNVHLPELFAMEHFGSISEMVQEVHLMKAIQLEQKRFEADFTAMNSSSSDYEDSKEREENEMVQEMLITESLQLDKQRSKIDSLKRELEEEIENIHLGIDKMKLALEKQAAEQSCDEEIPGWQEKFEKMKEFEDATPTNDGAFLSEKGEAPEGIEIEWEELMELLALDLTTDEPEAGVDTPGQSLDDSSEYDQYDGLDSEMEALNDFEKELREELESIEDQILYSFSRSGSFSLNKSIIDDRINDTVEVLFDNSTEESGERNGEHTVPKKVTFAATNQEYYFHAADCAPTVINFVDKDADSSEASSSTTMMCEFDELPLVFNDMFNELSCVFGWRTRPEELQAESHNQ